MRQSYNVNSLKFTMCKRGSAKDNVRDDHAFLLKHTIFGYLPNRNPSANQYEILHYVGELPDVPKMVGIGWL
jgi:hypothetical protein